MKHAAIPGIPVAGPPHNRAFTNTRSARAMAIHSKGEMAKRSAQACNKPKLPQSPLRKSFKIAGWATLASLESCGDHPACIVITHMSAHRAATVRERF